MDVIVIETQAFYTLVEDVVAHLLVKKDKTKDPIAEKLTITLAEAMDYFGLSSREYFFRFIRKQRVPHTKVGKIFHFNRLELIEYMARHKTRT